ncbi:MAG: flagellar basal body rod protein FlgC [Pseudomonadaceae bacterium]|nr:flagellar basal body rod protein FlgC [Pseudomonadaceae bacterium]
MDLLTNMNISAGGMAAQSMRMRVASENIANADSVESAEDAGGPYRAKQIFFQSVLNRATGATEVQVSGVSKDMTSPLKPVYQPGNKLANAQGYVMYPNVDSTAENINMREAQRSYEANMTALVTAREMATRTLDMLR